MAFPRIGGAGIGLNLNNALGSLLPSAPGVFTPSTPGSNAIQLAAAEVQNIPAGTYFVAPGPYTSLQWLDPVSTLYRTINADTSLQPIVIDSDGGNYRLANLTGTPVGALIVTAGGGLTNGIGTAVTGLTVTASAGASVWQPVAGGAISSSITITAGGTGYLFPPILVFGAPPPGGIQATGTCTLSAGAINAVTVTNQGAGYTSAPIIRVINDSRDTAGAGGVLTVPATLVGSGALTALYPTNPGNAVTAVPTFTFAGGNGQFNAIAVMNFVVTGFTIASGSSGAGYGNALPFMVVTSGGVLAAGIRATSVAGPIADISLTQPRPAQITGTSTAGGKIVASANGPVITDAGFGFQLVPSGIVVTGLATTAAVPVMTVGGITDVSWLQPV